MNKKNIFLWTLYDFANSIVTIVFFLYFSQWLVVERGVPDFWYNMIFTAGSILLLITAPVFGSLADRKGTEQKYLNRITLLTLLFYVGASLVALFWTNQVMLAALFFLLANYFYQFSFVFYNALLHRIAPPDKAAIISGYGQAGNWIGQITGLLITLPLAGGAIYLFGAVGRAQTFLPAAVLFFILALPMMIYLKLPPRQTQVVSEKLNWKKEYSGQWTEFKNLVKVPSMGIFLLAYFLFNDAILTASNNFPIFLEQVFSVSDSAKSLLLIGILVMSAIGAISGGYIANKIGLKKALVWVLASFVIVFPGLALAGNFTVFTIFAIAMGILYGAVWAVTRAVMVALCPPEKMNFGFSFYTLAERVSTLIGPLAWGLIVALLADHGPVRYRIALAAMAGFVLLGLLLVRKVQIVEAHKKIENPLVL